MTCVRGMTMEQAKHRLFWLLGFVAIACGAVALLRSYSASVQQVRQQALAQADALNRDFNTRAPVPLDAQIMISTENSNYQGPADLPSFRKHVASLGKLPAIIVLPGCGFPVWGKDVPLDVAVLSVAENPRLLDQQTSVEACMSKAGPALQRAFRRQLGFLTSYVERADWIDKTRLMIVGYGEAAPEVAAYTGPAKMRLTLGDPCFVSWNSVSNETPILMLFTLERQGLTRGDEPQKRLNITEIIKGAGPPLPRAKSCVGLPRPHIGPPARQIVASGRIDMFERPEMLSNAQKKAYDSL